MLDEEATFVVSRLPSDAAGIALPRTEFAQIALAAVQEASPAYLVHHCLRTFLFGCLLGTEEDLEFDKEILFIACALHDLGLTASHRGPLPFEIQGAQAARAILMRAGYPEYKAEIVWDGIAMHTQTLADFKRPEIRLVSAGASADVTGYALDQLAREHVQDVLDRFPRLGMKNAFIGVCAEVAKEFPFAATRSFMRDIAERQVKDFVSSNICDRIAASQFED